MKMVLLHSDRIWVKAVRKALKDMPSPPKEPLEVKECLVVFTAFEGEDEEKDPIPNAVEEVKKIAEKIGVKKVVVYPWVHLTQNPSSPSYAKESISNFVEAISRSGFDVYEAPFGYYKEFEIHVKGHPLAEWSRQIHAEKPVKKEVEEVHEEEGEMEDLFVIMPDGKIIAREDVKDPKVVKAIKAELKEITEASFGKPPHLELMKRLEIADHEPISDAGNLRYYPNGAFIVELLAELGWKMAVQDLGALPVRTPYIINPDHPSVKIMMGKFPERLYKVLPGSLEKKQEFRLRPACDYGVWSIFKDSVITHKNLPLGLYEFDIIWRYEQRGELLGMYRIRNAMMADLHEMTRDLDQAFERFLAHMEKFAIALYRYLGIEPSVIVLNCKRDFYDDHKNVFVGWAKELGIPIIVKLFRTMKTYKVAWIDVLAFDNLGRPMEVDTVQLDTESADWWDIKYIDEKGKEKRPLILHTGFGLDRTIAALLEHAYGASKKGENPMLPVWLSPIQLRFIPVSKDYVDYCISLAEKANSLGVRADVDDKEQGLGKKIRSAERQWIPYVAIVGEKELSKGKLSVRIRKTKQQAELGLEELVGRIRDECKGMPYKTSPFPIRLSRRPIFVGAS